MLGYVVVDYQNILSTKSDELQKKKDQNSNNLIVKSDFKNIV
jgi:hypothetical protein